LRNETPNIVSDREAKLRHSFHRSRAISARRCSVAVLGDIAGVHAIRESENGLDVSRAGDLGESGPRSLRPVLGTIFAPPSESIDVFVDIGLAFGGGISSYGEKVLREGNLGLVDVFVIGAKHHGVDFDELVSLDIIEGWDPLYKLW